MRKIDFSNYYIGNYQKYLLDYDFDYYGILEDNINSSNKNRTIINIKSGACVIFEKLNWDSNILGVTCAKAEIVFIDKKRGNTYGEPVKIIKAYCIKENISFISVRFPFDNFFLYNELEKHGFKTTDVLNTYLFIKNQSVININYNADACAKKGSLKNLNKVFDIAKNAFRYSRIYNDQNISQDRADEFYFKLTESIVKKNDYFTTVEVEDEIAGFCIGTIDKRIKKISKKKIGYLWLIAVAPEKKGLGYGKLLFSDFLKNFSEKVDYIEISTQINNFPANRLYSSFELKNVANIVTMHYWSGIK